MADSLTLEERSVQLGLMALIGEACDITLAAELDITLKVTEREHLAEAGYLTTRQTQDMAWMYELIDKGWRRCEEELASHAPEGAPGVTWLQHAITQKFAPDDKPAMSAPRVHD